MSLCPFPAVGWWCAALAADGVLLDDGERYEKGSRRNRYTVLSGTGPVNLSVPLAGGRNQRMAVGAVAISHALPWPRTHWRTLCAAYGSAPFWAEYAPALEHFFHTPYKQLAQFSAASIGLVQSLIGVKLSLLPDQSQPLKPYTDEAARSAEKVFRFPAYTQVFSDRLPFHPNLSILDLILCEGPHAQSYLLPPVG